MSGAAGRIRALIAEAKRWREFHRARKDHVQAAACAIRQKALEDALSALEKSDEQE